MLEYDELLISASDREAIERAVQTLREKPDMDAIRVLSERFSSSLHTEAARLLARESVLEFGEREVVEVVEATMARFQGAVLGGDLSDLDSGSDLWRRLVRWLVSEIDERLERTRRAKRPGSQPRGGRRDSQTAAELPRERGDSILGRLSTVDHQHHAEPAHDQAVDHQHLAAEAHQAGEPSGHNSDLAAAAPIAPLSAEEASGIIGASGVDRSRRSPQPGDPVDCSVFAPPEARPGDSVLVQVVAHTPEQAGQAKALAQEFDETARQRGYSSLALDIALNSRLTFHLRMPGLEIDDELAELIWRGRPASVQFGVKLPETHPPGNVVGIMTISQESVPVGRIKFSLRVQDAATARLPAPTGNASRFESFFVSYASQDRSEVIKRVAMALQLGKHIFQDILNLDPGDRWEQKLYLHIDKSDAVLLFWSSHAKSSEWVMRECRYAIEKKGIDCLIPVIIEGPPVVTPPPELAELHFNDRLLYFIR